MPATAVADAKSLNYVKHENEIHEFIFNDITRPTIDVSMDELDKLYREAPKERRVMIIYDFSKSGFPPASYAYRKLQDTLKRHPNRPNARVAIFHNSNGAILGLVQAFSNLIQMSNRDRIHFFTLNKREEALAWLQASK
jgi:hypothetical protein